MPPRWRPASPGASLSATAVSGRLPARPQLAGLAIAAVLISGCGAPGPEAAPLTGGGSASASSDASAGAAVASATSASSTVTPATPAGSASPAPMAQPSCEPSSTLQVTGTTWPAKTKYGFVRFFDGVHLYVDPVTFYTGAAAEKAAREDGEYIEGEQVDTFYRNPDTNEVQVSVAPGFRLSYLKAGSSTKRTALKGPDAATVYCAKAGKKIDPDRDWTSLLVKVTVVDGQVTKADEVFVS